MRAQEKHSADHRHHPGRRRPPRRVTVASVRPLTPRLVSILLTGEDLAGFSTGDPTSHIKVFFPPEGGAEPILPAWGPDGPIRSADGPRPVSRTYTPVRFDAASRTLEVQFLLHGDGPASRWAANAQVGDRIAVAGPGGRFDVTPDVPRWWIAGDESAIPAITTLLRELDPASTAEVHIEVGDATDELSITDHLGVTVHWHQRPAPDAFGTELISAALEASVAGDTGIWVGCEAASMRRIRRHFLDAGIDRRRLTTRGYWRQGTPNHPDHDHGDD
ncbi:MAG TPA: siderophore-interacting protein [Mycobacteriales bacterium]|nr:siderophore-interacting protein [Mycobacteriales bacterium]